MDFGVTCIHVRRGVFCYGVSGWEVQRKDVLSQCLTFYCVSVMVRAFQSVFISSCHFTNQALTVNSRDPFITINKTNELISSANSSVLFNVRVIYSSPAYIWTLTRHRW